MKLLLDECVTRYLKRDLTAHEVSTVEQAGFKGLKNGELLRAASAAEFDVLVTVDRNIPQQQNTDALSIALIILVAKSNAYKVLQPVTPFINERLKTIKPGEVAYIEAIKSVDAETNQP